MSTNTAAIVRQPGVFDYGEDFDLFFRQFTTYARNVKCDPTAQYDLLLSYLDKKSFRLVESIVYTPEELTALKADVTAALPKLKSALTPSDKMPAKVELKFRKQAQNESLSDFGFAIQTLGTNAFGLDPALNNGQVVDAFCLGVKSAELSAKLLSADFTTLSDAIAFALDKESAMTIRQYVIKNRATGGRSHDNDLSVLQAEDTSTLGIATLQSNGPGQSSDRDRGYDRSRTPYQQLQGSMMDNRYNSSTYGQSQGGYYRRGQHQDARARGVGTRKPSKSDVQCYLCNQFGHYATSCRLRDDSKACHYCGKVGHLIRTCFKRKNDEAANGTGIADSRAQQTPRGNFYTRPGNRRM